MPVPTATLEQQFSSLSTDDNKVNDKENFLNSNAAGGVVAPVALVTPTKEDIRNASETDSLTSDESLGATETPTKFLVQKTEHKLQEERGELETEPLLKENPHRFVIFPIQDNDVGLLLTCVSALCRNTKRWSHCHVSPMFLFHNASALGNVQEGGSLLLDLGRD